MVDEIAMLERAYRLFGDAPMRADVAVPRIVLAGSDVQAGSARQQYQLAVRDARALLRATRGTDGGFATILAAAQRDVLHARAVTKQVLDNAVADAATQVDTPAGQRELLRRSAARLESSRQQILWAQQRANRWLAALRVLRYTTSHRGSVRDVPNTRAGHAVRAALSKVGRPYVWGASGPNQFDCSGLVQWAYAQAGVPLDRTTYDQINQGVAVPLSQVRPGDLVFPHSGHVQIAIGNNQVVEAPYSGASVRITELGSGVTIRRPVP